MTYNLSDESVRVANLQELLRTLWLVTGEDGYEVGANGTFGEGTERAVRYFQIQHGLPVTGVADLATWNAIREEADALRYLTLPPRPIRPFYPERDAAVRYGEVSDVVTIIQIMLDALSSRYDFVYIPVSGVYDKATADAVRQFQEAGGIPSPAGVVDRLTWNALAEEYMATLRSQ